MAPPHCLKPKPVGHSETWQAEQADRRTGSEAPWLHRAALKYASLDCSQNQGDSDIGSDARGRPPCYLPGGGEFRAICPVAGFLLPGPQFPIWEPR